MYIATQGTHKIADLRKRIRAVAGGTSASKTISTLLVLIQMALLDKEPTLTSVVSESMPHLKKAAMRDFLDIMVKHKYYKEAEWNRTDSIYTFPNGSKIEFFGVDSADKVRGPRRDRLFINECNNVPYSAFEQLEVRTRKIVFLDWNPTNEFWFYTELLPNREKDIDFITLTYKDNEALEPSIVQSIESRQYNKQWWRVYGLGLLGESEGRIYTGWRIIDEIPFEARLEGYGLDFGYSNDPTAIVAVYYLDGGYILDEIAYEKGLSNKAIGEIFETIDRGIIVADSAEPKSIDELRSMGLTVIPAQKGQGSVNQGIQKLQDARISITKQSTDGIAEYRNYLWDEDKDGHPLNKPIGGKDHFLDAARYRMEALGSILHQAPIEIIGYEQGLGGIEIPIFDL